METATVSQTSPDPKPRQRRALAALPTSLHPEQRLTAEQAQALLGTGRSKFYDDVRAGRLPQPERDGVRFARWRAGDLLDLLAARRVAA